MMGGWEGGVWVERPWEGGVRLERPWEVRGNGCVATFAGESGVWRVFRGVGRGVVKRQSKRGKEKKKEAAIESADALSFSVTPSLYS